MQQLSKISSLVLILLMLGFVGCEGPAGEQGPQGQQGPQGPVGPAGEDGSMMYSGQGAPDASTGENGDYYLDTDTGELYGPKDGNGWGNPIMVLMGQDGQDGEDGSQIYAGSGAPSSSLGQIGDFYLDQANYDMYGPKTDQGWGSPINLKGADGNANVTRYIFPGHDFAADDQFLVSFSNTTRQDMIQSAWLKYLVHERQGTNNILTYYDMPGYGIGGYTQYSASHYQSDFYTNRSYVEINRRDGTGESYDRIEIVRIEANNTEDQRKQKSGEILPSGLDTSDYEAVAEYYGFYR